MGKRIISIVIILLLLINTIAFADPLEMVYDNNESVLVIDYETSKVLIAKRAFERQRISGLSKLMVFLVAMDEIKLNKEKLLNGKIIISSKDIEPDYKNDIKEGETYTLETLIKLMFITDSKAAPRAIANHFSISEETFVKKMNAKAKKIGLKDTKFYNTNGDSINGKYNYSTAWDLYNLTDYILKKYPMVLYYSSEKSISINNDSVHINTNLYRFLNTIPASDGLIRTYQDEGYQSYIGTYIINKDTKDPYRIISITMNNETEPIETNQAIYNYIKDNVKASSLDTIGNLPINNTKKEEKEKPISLRQALYNIFK